MVKERENEILGGKSDIFRIRIKNRTPNTTAYSNKLKATVTMISIAVPPEYGWVVLGAG
jgi:hypothetical protein